MTCVVGLVAEDGKVWLGADSATSWDADHCRVQITRNPKVFRVGTLLIGSSGSGRVQALLRSLVVPKRPRGVSAYDYVAGAVADAVRKLMFDAGATIPPHEGDPLKMPYASSILIGYKGGLYRMDEDFSVDEAADEIDAVGSGASWALPVLEMMAGKPPKDRITAALKASERHCWSVRRPFRVEAL